MPKKIGYIRVSKRQGQKTDRQVLGLQTLCDELRTERISAIKKARPVFDRLIARLAPGDTLVVWDLDRAFRSAIDALIIADGLRERGVHFKVVSMSIDTATPAGRFAYTVWAAAAEYERNLIVQRTMDGLRAARKKGNFPGRPRKLDRRQVLWARQKLQCPYTTMKQTARRLNCHPHTLARALKFLEMGW